MGEEIRFDRRSDLIVFEIERTSSGRPPRVRDNDVEPPEVLERSVDEQRRNLGITDITGHRPYSDAFRRKSFRCSTQCLSAASIDDQRDALASERFGDASPETLRGTGHDRNLAADTEIHQLDLHDAERMRA